MMKVLGCAGLILMLGMVACRRPQSGGTAKPQTGGATGAQAPQLLVGAGDVADCADLSGTEATATLLGSIPGTVFVVGDLVYPDGTDAQFSNCYAPTWGRYKARTRPALGNHEYNTPRAVGYFHYFGSGVGELGQGYYSYELGEWHIVVLNSNCSEVGGCGPGSPQERWLRQDLAAHPSSWTLSYWHDPLFSSSELHDNLDVKPIWDDLHAAGATVVLNGHDHNYERFAPQDPNGALDPARGVREFVVGTGGKDHVKFVTDKSNSEKRDANAFGILKLTLYSSSYAWDFVSVPGTTFTDSGRGDCHPQGARPASLLVAPSRQSGG
jgi:acid phosphatase type 7